MMKPGESVWIITAGTTFETQRSPTPCSSQEVAIRTVEHLSESTFFRIGPIEWEEYNNGDGLIGRFKTQTIHVVPNMIMVIYHHTIDEFAPKQEDEADGNQ